MPYKGVIVTRHARSDKLETWWVKQKIHFTTDCKSRVYSIWLSNMNVQRGRLRKWMYKFHEKQSKCAKFAHLR